MTQQVVKLSVCSHLTKDAQVGQLLRFRFCGGSVDKCLHIVTIVVEAEKANKVLTERMMLMM